MKKLPLLLAILLPLTLPAEKPKPVIVGYILANRNIQLDPSKIAGDKLTRINYAFFRLQNGLVTSGNPNDEANLAALNSLKKTNPDLQVLISVGGGGAGSAGFSDMAITPDGRKKFIDSAIAAVEKYSLDGIDIDWEYPGYSHTGATVRPEDKQTYTLLLKELKQRLNHEEKKLGRKLYTSSATGATQIWINHTNMKQASRWLDSVNMMCYDWYSTGTKYTGHDSPLYTNPADPESISIDNAVALYRAAGVPMKKLVIGVPFYGYKFTGIGPTNNGLWQPAPKQPSTQRPPINTALTTASTTPRTPRPPTTGIPSTPVYSQIEPLIDSQGFTRHWDPIAMAPWLYNPTTKTFITYNDAQAEFARTTYIRNKKLGGIMFWQYTGDPNNVLLDAIDQGLNYHQSTK